MAKHVADKRRTKNKDKLLLRDMDVPMVLGFELDRRTLTPVRRALAHSAPGQDYGCDPMGDGTFRMVPSGDIVDIQEKERRLARFRDVRH